MADRITMSRETTAAPDRVWAVLTDLDAAAATLSGVTAIEKLTPGPYRVGTRWRETRTMLGRQETQELEVTGVEALGSTRIEAHAGGIDYVTTFDLESLHPGTRLTMTFEGVQPDAGPVRRLVGAALAPLGRRVTNRIMSGDLDDLVAAAERPAAPARARRPLGDDARTGCRGVGTGLA